MCTAVWMQADGVCFGRTLDYSRSYGETVTVMPRRFPLTRLDGQRSDAHYSVIGMAADLDFSGGYPLFYDGVNEKGLAMAGLNFVRSAVYGQAVGGKGSLAVHEVIPTVLGLCGSVEEAKAAFSEIRITDAPFFTPQGQRIPPARLHWLVGDSTGSVTVEYTAEGLRIYDNPVGVLTNDPPFPKQMEALEQCGSVPEDHSSTARFLRAADAVRSTRQAACGKDCTETFFRIMERVTLPAEGEPRENDQRWYTLYTCCMHGGVYHCLPYGGELRSASLWEADLTGRECMRCFSVFSPKR